MTPEPMIDLGRGLEPGFNCANPRGATVEEQLENEYRFGCLVRPTLAPLTFYLIATHYGSQYQGQPMGCPPITMPAGRGGYRYETTDPQIVAAGYVLAKAAPCGMPLEVCGQAGCIQAYRLDSCPGCDEYGMVDLSEAGIEAVCGGQASCAVTVKVGAK